MINNVKRWEPYPQVDHLTCGYHCREVKFFLKFSPFIAKLKHKVHAGFKKFDFEYFLNLVIPDHMCSLPGVGVPGRETGPVEEIPSTSEKSEKVESSELSAL